MDTVDFGVYEKLPFEVKNKTDWSLVIGHMLGVDHCGHTFGSLTPHIGKKLLEIDSFIDDVINIVDEDTLVMTFGDHGMTISGDHGGESEHETDAALYVYAPKGFRNRLSFLGDDMTIFGDKILSPLPNPSPI